MTEAEWLACTDPALMLEFLRRKASDRRLRLFAVACCRRIWDVLKDQRSHVAVDTSERFADGLIDVETLGAAASDAWSTSDRTEAPAYASKPVPEPTFQETIDVAMATSNAAAEARADATPIVTYGTPVWEPARKAERTHQCTLLRCIFGNPFRPSPPLPPAVLNWNDGTVRRIAEGIYEDRAFARLPVMADALLDAGCEDEELLAHCRSEGPHVRGCWAVDLILGKS
jgi:hypothetical protein